ncbi:DUF2256 domain-containing protein [Armatimonas rosea]|uniref:DUF2256 domain-containing protein n=1 Tax=Armatimonas rosea TaxID=685828 RepID=A0A7W9W5G9_ARMRO|nr:DUF2256 domain-containing protein [Armatimonas rosea]MBB6049021.1 hypothetical protein [Armatimonas rosea]
MKTQAPKAASPCRNPHNLPTKVCPTCQRAFTWRKKWERDWESVRYCSDACRRKKDA